VNLEAKAAGRPVVATRVGGVPEIVLDGETGVLVPPEDASALAAAMRRVLTDNALSQSLGQEGQRRAAEFTWPHLAGKYQKIYRDLLQKRSSS
jgi:starch synthase